MVSLLPFSGRFLYFAVRHARELSRRLAFGREWLYEFYHYMHYFLAE